MKKVSAPSTPTVLWCGNVKNNQTAQDLRNQRLNIPVRTAHGLKIRRIAKARGAKIGLIGSLKDGKQ